MSERYEGFVAKISTKTGTGKRGAWTLYSGKIEKADGTEYKDWVSFGFETPPFKEGDFISFDTELDGDRVKAIKGTFKMPKNAPARKAKEQAAASQQGNKAGSGGRGGYTPQKFDGTGIQNRTNPVDAQRMGLANARTAAIEVTALLLERNALPLTKAATKAGEAARFDEVIAVVDKLTVRYYNDLSGRLLETVADDGATTKPVAGLPDSGETEAAAEESQTEPEAEDDDIPY